MLARPALVYRIEELERNVVGAAHHGFDNAAKSKNEIFSICASLTCANLYMAKKKKNHTTKVKFYDFRNLGVLKYIFFLRLN